MNFSEEQLAMMSPEEQSIARDAMAATAAGRDVLAEADADAPGAAPAPTINAPEPSAAEQSAPAPAAEAAPPAADTPSTAVPAPEPAAAAQATTEPAQAAPAASEPTTAAHADIAPTQAYVVDPQKRKQLVDERKDLRGQIAEIDKKWGAGDINDEERQAQLSPLQDQIDDITGALAVMQSLQASSQMTVEQQQRSTIAAIMQRGAQVGLDYAKDTGLQGQFNAIMDGLDADPANAHLSFGQLADKAHQTMLAIHGKLAPPPAAQPSAPAAAPAAAAPAAPAQPPARHPPAAPTTLRDIPAAQRANEGFQQGTLADQVLSGNAMEAEERWGKLSKAQRDALLNG